MERPLERRASLRTAVIWDACAARLGSDGPRAVLDIGGGTGGLAVRIAELGHRVTVVDPNPDALAALNRRSREHGVEERITGVQGDLDGLAELTDSGSIDLVLCHEVLGLVADPGAALDTIGRVLRPGGALSLVVSQRHAAVLARAMAGHFARARALLDEPGEGERRFSAEELESLLAAHGFTLDALHGVRVFTDLVPSTLLDLEPGAVGGLLDLERAVAEKPEYRALAAQLHALATR